MTYDKNTGGDELIDFISLQKNGSALTTNLQIDFKSSRTSLILVIIIFAVSISKKVIPL